MGVDVSRWIDKLTFFYLSRSKKNIPHKNVSLVLKHIDIFVVVMQQRHEYNLFS